MQIEIDFLIHFLHRISATDTASLKNTQKKPINQKINVNVNVKTTSITPEIM